MKYVILVLSLLFFGCSDTGKPVEITKMETFERKVVCNEFGMVYYENYPHGGKVYTPVIAPSNKPLDDHYQSTVHLTCEEYISLKKGK